MQMLEKYFARAEKQQPQRYLTFSLRQQSLSPRQSFESSWSVF